MVGTHLLVIVPVNWLVFRLLGRVEWAWAAVPALAIGWGLVVIWMAQLDIGFARSETEVAVLEMHQGFPRPPDAIRRVVFVAVDRVRRAPGRFLGRGPTVFDRRSTVARPALLDGHAATPWPIASWTTIPCGRIRPA